MKIVGKSGDCETGIASCGRKWRKVIFFLGIHINQMACSDVKEPTLICAHLIPVSNLLRNHSSITYNDGFLQRTRNIFG